MGQLTFQATLGGSINLVGPNTASTVNFTLPSADGTNGQSLRTNGSGTLSFGTLAVAAGGTGVTTSTGSGNVVLSTSPTLVTPILGTPQSVTLTSGTGLPLSTGVTGTLPVANGGTGSSSLTSNNVLLGNGTSAVQVVAPSTNGNVLTSNGTTWVSQALTPSGVSSVATSGGLTGGTITSTGTLSIDTNNVNGVGSYMICGVPSTTFSSGGTIAGSSLRPAFAQTEGYWGYNNSAPLSGTWRNSTTYSSSSSNYCSLFIRTA